MTWKPAFALLATLAGCATSPPERFEVSAGAARPLDAPADAHPDYPVPGATAEYAAIVLGDELARALGLDRASLGTTPPMGRLDVEILRPWLDLGEARGCLKRREDGRGVLRPDARWASFVASVEGGPASDVRVELGEGGETEAACVGAALTARPLPRLRVGGRTWVRLEGTGPRAPAAAEVEPPSFAGYAPPRVAAEGCIEKALKGSARLGQDGPGSLRARFTVEKDGTVTRFTLGPPGFDLEVARTLRRAITACAWVPARDPSGAPASVWVVLPVALGAG